MFGSWKKSLTLAMVASLVSLRNTILVQSADKSATNSVLATDVTEAGTESLVKGSAMQKRQWSYT